MMPVPTKVLLVEGDPVYTASIRAALAEAPVPGFTLAWAETLAHARRLLGAERFEVVLLDIRLPDGAGAEAVAAVRGAAGGAPIVVLAGRTDEAAALEAVEMGGAEDYLIRGEAYSTVFVRAIRHAIERQRARRRLEASEQRYRSLFEHNPDIVCSFDLEGRIVEANAALERVLGFTVEAIRGTHFGDYVVAEDLERTKVCFERAAAGEPQGFEVRALHRDGGRAELSVTVLPIVVDGRITGVHGIGKDVTDRNAAACAQAADAERLKLALEAGELGSWELDLASRRLQWSRRLEEIHGIEPGSFAGTLDAFLETVHPEDRDRVRDEIERAIAEGRNPRIEFRIVRPDGEVRWLEGSGRLLGDAEGRPERLLGVDVDVTEWVLREEAVRRANAATAALIEASPLPIVSVDRGGVVRLWNAAASALFGWTAEEVLDRPCPIIPEDRLDEHRRLVRDSFSRDRACGHETRRRRKDGSLVDVAIWSAPLLDAEGTVERSMAVYADMTERRRLEEQLHQAQKMEAVGRLAGGIAHDFNNVLTAIKGHIQILIEDSDADAALTEELREVRAAADRASSLTRQLLAFSRKQTLQPQRLELNGMVQDLERMLARLIGEDIVLETALSTERALVSVDPGHLQHVILNLVVNARDAMPSGGRLSLRTGEVGHEHVRAIGGPEVPPGRYVMLAVSDTGIGMSRETQERIFEPFFTTKEQGKGTGLGLSSVYGIVKQSGGFLSVESESGRGTTFKIYLPGTDEPPLAPRPAATGGSDGDETVLLIEDEDSVRRLARRVLERRGYRVLEAADGVEAIALADAHPDRIHLVVTDVVMPGIDGRRLAERLLERRPELRVLLMSGYTEDEIVRRGSLDRAIHMLEKPFTPDALTRTVREVLDGTAEPVARAT